MANEPEQDHVGASMKYFPWTDGYAVGFRCESPCGRVEYVYLNPSSEDSEGQPNIFLYHGLEGKPFQDAALLHVNVGPEKADPAVTEQKPE